MALVSVATLRDAGYVEQYDSRKVEDVKRNEQLVLRGYRNRDNGQWNTDAAIGTMKQAALGSPTLRTLEQALQEGSMPEIPCLTLAGLRKHPVLSHDKRAYGSSTTASTT